MGGIPARRAASNVMSPTRARKKSRPTRAAPSTKARARHASPDGRDAHRRTALEVLEQFRLIFRSSKKHFQWVHERTGVSGAQLWVLAELQRRPGIRVTELARALAVHQSTASNLVERLRQQRLLQRVRQPDDRRVVQLTLTHAGREILARAPQPLEGVLNNALNALEHGELIDLLRRLEGLARRMKVRDARGKRIPLADL